MAAVQDAVVSAATDITSALLGQITAACFNGWVCVMASFSPKAGVTVTLSHPSYLVQDSEMPGARRHINGSDWHTAASGAIAWSLSNTGADSLASKSTLTVAAK